MIPIPKATRTILTIVLAVAATEAIAAQRGGAPSEFMAEVRAMAGGAPRCSNLLPQTGQDGRVTESPLVGKIAGAAAGTTGGLGTRLYVVSKLDDAKPSRSRSAPEGTIRWAVEAAKSGGGGWIALDPSLEGELRLEASLHLPSNTTIDGGCGKVEILSPPRVTQIVISGSSNVIVAGLGFTKTAYDDKEDKTGDAIGIVDEFDRVAILHNRFRRCGDGCVDIVRRTRSDATSRATVSFNTFSDHNKVMLIGTLTCYSDKGADGCSDPMANVEAIMKPRVFVTVAGNAFIRTSQRHPKVVSNAKVHLVQNLFQLTPTAYSSGEDSAVYGAATGSAGVLLAERNIFVNELRAPRVGIGPISAVRAANGGGGEPDGFVAAADNFVVGNVRTAENRPEIARAAFPQRLEPSALTPAVATSLAACLLKVAGPAGRGLDWPQACRD